MERKYHIIIVLPTLHQGENYKSHFSPNSPFLVHKGQIRYVKMAVYVHCVRLWYPTTHNPASTMEQSTDYRL